jgi:hypothetical protein
MKLGKKPNRSLMFCMIPNYITRSPGHIGSKPGDLIILLLKRKSSIEKQLGRPSAVREHVSPGERNPIEGKSGQAKTTYGMDRIKARLKDSSQTRIAMILMVTKLVKLTRSIPYSLIKMIVAFSARLEIAWESKPEKNMPDCLSSRHIIDFKGKGLTFSEDPGIQRFNSPEINKRLWFMMPCAFTINICTKKIKALVLRINLHR